MKKTFFILLIFISNLTYGQIPNELSKEEKIYGLSKFWQEVNYNFVYFENIDQKEWDENYKKLVSEVQNTPNDYEYYRLLQKFCALLKDGHTNVWFPKAIQENVLSTEFGEFSLHLSNIEGKAIVSKVSESKKNEFPVGTEVTRVNGLPTNEYINLNVKPYISSSTEHILDDWSVMYLLQGYKGSSFDLEFKLPNGEVKHQKLTLTKNGEEELYPKENNDLLEFKWLSDDIAYIALNSFSSWDIMDAFSDIFSEVQKAKKLVIDIRKNGGGDESIGREIIKYFTNDTTLYGSKSKTRLNNSYFKAVGRYSNVADTLNNDWSKQAYLTHHNKFYHDFPYYPYSTANLDFQRVEIPTAILIGHNTGSAAEDFLIYSDNLKNMVKIGEPTFGSTGQPMVFELPNGGVGRVCTKKDFYPDGREFVGFGIKPDIEIKTTLSNFIEKEDPVLKEAKKYLNKLM